MSLVNLHVTAKNHLLARTTEHVSTVCNDLIGLHATSDTTPYLSLYNRLERFLPETLDEELYERKGLFRIRAMRGTLFLVTRQLLPLILEATGRFEQGVARGLDRWGVSRREFESISESIVQALSSGPKTGPQLRSILEGSSSKTLTRFQGRRGIRRTKVNEVLNLLVYQGKIWSNVEPVEWGKINWDDYGSRIFTSIRRVFYQLPQALTLGRVNLREAKRKLAELYIKRYGPVTVEDVAWWMGESVLMARKLVGEQAEELALVSINGLRGEFLLHRGDFDSLRSLEPNKEPVVHLLPYEDPYPKSRKMREGIIPPRLGPLVYATGSALPSVLVDGRIMATWNVAVKDSVLKLTVGKLAPIGSTIKLRVEEAARKLGKFLMPGARVLVSVRGGRTSKWQAISLSAKRRNRSVGT